MPVPPIRTRPPVGPFLVRYAAALGTGWKRGDFERAPTLFEARVLLRNRRVGGFHAQIIVEGSDLRGAELIVVK